MWETQILTTEWASTACYTDSFTFFLPFAIYTVFIKNLIYELGNKTMYHN
jgi:hypothetical protein